MKLRLVLILTVVAASLGAIAGCGGSDDGGGSDPASLAPAQSPIYIEATIQPEGDLKSNLEALAKNLAGVDDLGGLIVSELEDSAVSSGEDGFDFEQDMAPWLGEKAGISLQEYDGDDFQGYVVAIATTDGGAAEEFLDQTPADEIAEEGSYEGNDFMVEEDGDVSGVIGDFLVVAEDEGAFKSAVDASGGESLLDQEAYGDAVAAAPEGSLADAFVDIGGLIDESGGAIDAEAKELLGTAGIDPEEATAVASLVPGADQIEIDISSNAAGENPPTGDASSLLGSLPGGSFAAGAAPDVGASLSEAIDSLDENGIPGEIPPNQLKQTMKAAGIDLEKIGATIGDVGFFAQGNTEANLTGAVVIEATDAKEATNTVSNIGLLLRASGTAGITALSGEAAGFSIKSPDLGDKPIVVAAKGSKIAISYGLPASAQALSAGEGSTLADNPNYKEAVSALGDAPISAFVSGPSTIALIENMLPAEDRAELEEVRPILDKVSYLAVGTGSDGDVATAKLILGFGAK